MIIDFEHAGVPEHLGQIAEIIRQWEGRISDKLQLKSTDVAAIKLKYPLELKLQTYGYKLTI